MKRPTAHEEERLPIDRRTWQRFRRVLRQFTSSDVGWKAKLFFAALMVLLVAINALNVASSYVVRDFMSAIEYRDRAGFFRQTGIYVAFLAALTIVAVLYRYIEERLALLWRSWLTRHLLHRYLSGRVYYRLESSGEIGNPDQRIADDTRVLTVTTLSFLLLILNAAFTVLAFAGVLLSISGTLFAVAVAYAVVGSMLAFLLGRPLVWFNYDQLDREAYLRADLLHIRQNAESVAMLRREGRLRARLLRDLDALILNMRRIIAVNRNLGFFTTSYNYLVQVIPVVVIAPLFIRGEVPFGVIAQSTMAFAQLLGAFSLIVTQFQSISSYTAVVARLSTLGEALDRADIRPPGIDVHEDKNTIVYDRLTLTSASTGRLLVKELSATVRRGMRLLVRAQNAGAGVALLRATADLSHRGEGRVLRPDLDSVLFLPERPYMPPGKLRESLLRTDHEVPDAQILRTLRELGIEDAAVRVGGLDAARDWDDVLSLGEQQLFGVARLLLAAPPFVFLDRIDTALDGPQVERVLELLARRSIAYVAFQAARGDPRHFDAVLDIAADGTWECTPF